MTSRFRLISMGILRWLAGGSEKRSSRHHRILFVAHSAQLGGAEKSLLDILSRIDRELILPFVLLPEKGPFERELRNINVPYARTYFAWWLHPRNTLPRFVARLLLSGLWFPHLIAKVRKLNPDLVYTNSLVVPQGAVAALLLRKPHIWHVRELVEDNEDLETLIPVLLLFRLVSVLSARVIAVAQSVKAQFPPGQRESVRVIYNGIDLGKRHCIGLGDYGPKAETVARRLILVGRLARVKGQLDAIKAIRILKEEFPDVSLLLVGDGTRQHVSVLEKYIASCGLTGTVSLVGYVEDPSNLVRGSDVSVVPSRTEAFGRVTLESLAAGVPVVGTDVDGTAEILRHGGGILVPPGRPDLLAAALRNLFESPDLLRKLRDESRMVAARFPIERTVTRIQTEILELLS